MNDRIDTKTALEDSADLIEAMEKRPKEILCVMEEGFRLLILKQAALGQEIADRKCLQAALVDLGRTQVEVERRGARIEALEKAARPVLLAVFDSMWTLSAKGECSLADDYFDKLYDACLALSAVLAPNDTADAISINKSPEGEIIADGFGNTWSAICPQCGGKMSVVRPGAAQCEACG